MRALPSRLDRTEFARVDTCLSDTVLTVFRDRIAGNRAVLAGRADNLNDVSIINGARRLPLRKTHSLPDNFSFFVDTTTKLRRRARDQFQRDVISSGIQFPGKSQLCDFVEHIMFDFNHIFISIHRVYLALFSSLIN